MSATVTTVDPLDQMLKLIVRVAAREGLFDDESEERPQVERPA